ncbi:MAG: sugar ABC transporter ATP-binding protein [Anaerolineae bacterium]|nr:sugar ABC transporter ATP-binding protein [Anaerolineae bacterium]
MNVLEARAIKKSFGGVKALVDGNISCCKGEIVGLLGANGCGKTTFSRILMGMLNCDDGEILINGERVSFNSPMDAMQRGLAMVHQQLSLIPDMTVWENINIGNEPRSALGFIDTAACRQRARQVLERLCPEVDMERKVSELSPSEQQLVEIAKALSKDFNILILDEPTSALEQVQVNRLFDLLRQVKQQGATIIFISHRLGEVVEICDYVVVFRNGANVGTVDLLRDGQDEERIIALITGREEQAAIAKKHGAQQNGGGVRFAVKDLCMGKLRQISFALRRGEIVGIGGLQGQGQEELLLTLAGLLAPAERGSVLVDDIPLKLHHPSDAIRQGVVLVPGDRKKEGLFLNHSILMNMMYARFSLKGEWIIPFRKYRREAEEIMRALSIKAEGVDTELNTLSGGNQQKVVVGKWLPLNPKVLLLCDPAKGVDVQAKKELYELVARLAQQGTSILLYASDNEELVAACERVFVMYEGQIVEELQGAEVTEDNLVAASLRARTTPSTL